MSFRRNVLAAFAVSSLLAAALVTAAHSRLHLTLEISASRPSTAQLFYDIGRGYNERDSHSAPVISRSLNNFEQLSFVLPLSPIRSLRFDPLTEEGQFVVRDVRIRSNDVVLARIPAADITSFNQIAKRVQRREEVEFATIPGAKDPGITLHLHEPFKLIGALWFKAAFSGENLRALAILEGFLIAAMISILLLPQSGFKRVCAAWLRRMDSVFAAVAHRLSDENFLVFDSAAIWFYVVCIMLFLTAAVLNLNGSSAGMYSLAYGHGAHAQKLIGSPRASRSDEWAYETPDILNQALRAQRFEVRDSVLGGHSVALIGNVPVWHVSTLFRPQFWSFFMLPLDYAFAFYWQGKGLILLTGVFTWLLLISRSTFWAVTGALWYFFSPLTQWSYSWPTGLPEMVGAAGLCTVFTCYLTVGRNTVGLIISALGAVLFAIDFALCSYIPHMIPLVLLNAALVIAWCVSVPQRILAPDGAKQRLLVGASAVCVAAIVGYLVFADLNRAIAAIANTAYPGKRMLPGGSMPLWQFGSHFLQWTATERPYPPALGNICEGSGFLWLAPATWLCVSRATFSRFHKFALIALWCCFALIVAWLILPLPASFGRIFGLDKTLGARCLPALGLANIAIVVLCLSQMRQRKGGWPFYAVCSFATFVPMLIVLWGVNHKLDSFFSLQEVMFGALFVAVLMPLIITPHKWAFALALIIPQALVSGTVNPVERGLDVFTSSQLYSFIHSNPKLLHGKWIIFSDTVVDSGFFAAMGCDVYTGTRYLPDIDHFSLFASRKLDLNVFNRLGYLNAHPLWKGEKTTFKLVNPVVVEWDVDPNDPILRELGIKYLAFNSPPRIEISSKLVALSNQRVDGFSLYQLR